MIILSADIIDKAEKAAGLSPQGVLFLIIFVCAGALAYMFRDAKKTAEKVATEHAASMEKLINKMEERSLAMDIERRERIAQLLLVIKEETAAKVSMADAIRANTSAVVELRLLFQNAKLPTQTSALSQ